MDETTLSGVCHQVVNHNEDVTGIGSFALIALSIGVVVATLQKKFKWLQLPYTLLLFIIGTILGTVVSNAQLGILNHSVQTWLGLKAELLMFIFLPPLLFASAFTIEYHIFRRLVWQAVLLATLGVILAAVLLAVVAFTIFGYGWGWEEALLFGKFFS